jgi:hypothetical protein
MAKVLFLTQLESKVFEALINCCIKTAPGKERIRNIYKKLEDYFQKKGEKINSGMIWFTVDILTKVGILKKVFEKAIPGEKKEKVTFEFSRNVYEGMKVETVKRRSPEMVEKMGLTGIMKSKASKMAKKEPLGNDEKEMNDMELVMRVREYLEGKKRERENVNQKLVHLDEEIREIEEGLESFKRVRLLFLSKIEM